MDMQASIRTLECLVQKDNEGFSEYLTRWKSVCSQLPNRPHDRDLIAKFINNLRPVYQTHMRYSGIENFRQAQIIGMRIEDDLRTGIMSKFVGRGYQGGSSRNTGHTIKTEEPTTINVLDVLSTTKKERREFTPIRMTYAEAFKRLTDQGLIEVIGPTEAPATKPSWYKENEYCPYHRGKGHTIENCFRFKHKVQDLIDSGKLPKPKQPSNQGNPLFNHA